MVLITVKRLFLIFLIIIIKIVNSSDKNLKQNISSAEIKNDLQNLTLIEVRNFKDNENYNKDQNLIKRNENKIKKVTPFRNTFLEIYRNYKSTYLSNKTVSEYRKFLNRKLTTTPSSLIFESSTTATEIVNVSDSLENNVIKKRKYKKNKKKLSKDNDDSLIYSYNGEYRYNVGPGVNVSLDMERNIVNVDLDEKCLKDILLVNWDDDSDEGRGKKYDMISKILPLFILPFLIQSAIIPFLVTKLKLLLINSILVGKLAIFLIIITAIKNNQKVNTYEPPSYWATDPMRRSEIFNNGGGGGYRYEGRP